MASGKFELSHLRSFLAVAEEFSFRVAADRLKMTQPTLSHQIRLLEYGIGLMLFERNNRTVRLTPAGESFLASAGDLLERAEYAVLTARQAERGEVGAIAMGFVPSAAMGFVPQIVNALAERLPAITFRATEMMSCEILDALRSDRLDLGLTRMSDRNREIKSRSVFNQSIVLALPAGHPLAKVDRATLADLDGED